MKSIIKLLFFLFFINSVYSCFCTSVQGRNRNLRDSISINKERIEITKKKIKKQNLAIKKLATIVNK